MQPNNPGRPNPAGQRPQFFDVVRPGRTPASPNSRPTLPNNRPAVADSSMKQGAPAVPPGLMSQKPAITPVQAPARVPVLRPQQIAAPIVTQPAQPTPVSQRPQQVFNSSPASTQQPEVSSPVQDEPETFAQAQPAHQKHSFWSEFLAILAILLLVGVIVNILLDAEIINLPLPHTNFFEY